MKINIAQIPPEGFTLKGSVSAKELELDSEVARSQKPIQIKAEVNKIADIVSIDLDLNAPIIFTCSRCLEEFEVILEKNLMLNYKLDKTQHEIDLDSDIRQDIILEYPIRPLCKDDCKGLCLKCGENLNKRTCNCP